MKVERTEQLNSEGQIAELSYAALRERDRADKAEAEISALQSRLERAEQALQPFVDEFMRHAARYKRGGSNWFEEMPGHWHIELKLTMGQCRQARAAIDQALGGKE